MQQISTWLLQQTPVIIVMGIVIYFLYKAYVKKQEAYDNLVEKVVKIATLYESKIEERDNIKSKEEEILITMLSQIRDGLVASKIIKP